MEGVGVGGGGRKGRRRDRDGVTPRRAPARAALDVPPAPGSARARLPAARPSPHTGPQFSPAPQSAGLQNDVFTDLQDGLPK